MKLLFLLLTMTRWPQQLDSDSSSSGMSGCPEGDSNSTEMPEYASDKETVELSFVGHDGVLCNLSVNTTTQCLMDIELGNISCSVAQDSDSPNTTALCTNHTSTVELTKTINSTIKYTQTVNSPTTVSICPTSSSSLNRASAPLISGTGYNTRCPACTPSTVMTTVYQQKPPMVLSNMMSSCPACRPSTVTTTIYQQSPVVLSNIAEIGVLATSAVLICLPILALVIVTYCWVRTRRTLKKKRSDPGMKFVYLAQDSFPKSLSLHNNESTETAKKINTPLYTVHEDKTQKPAMNLKPIMTTEPNPPRHPSNDNPLIHEDEITKQAKNLKPVTAIESKSPRHPSNGPIYATPWNSKKRDDKDSKNTKIGASEEKSGEGVAVGVASQKNSQVEPEEGIKQNFQEEQVGKENERTASASRSKPQYERSVVAAKGKVNEGRVSASKRKVREHHYDKPVIAAKENVGQVKASKQKVCEHLYDKPAIAAKRKENEGRASASRQKVCEHEYDKPVVAAKPKKLQGKKGKGVDSGGKEEHKYHVLEGPVPRDEDNPNKQESKEGHEYHILEEPVPREESNDKKPDMQEGGNVYHVLEEPTLRDENDTKKQDKQEWGNVYHVLEGPTLRDDNSDRNPNVYHVLEGPAPRDEKLDKQESGNVYHVLEGPTLRDDSNDKNQKKENVYHVLEGPVTKYPGHSKNVDKQKRENVYHVLEGPTPIEDET